MFRKVLAGTLAFVLGWSMFSAGALRAAETTSLDHAAIVTDADNASYVQYAVEDLAGYLKDLTGTAPAIQTALPSDAHTVIVIGSKVGRQILGDAFPDEKLGDQGFLLKTLSKDGKDYIVITGIGPHGTKEGVSEFIKSITVDGKSVAAPKFDLHSTPIYAKRGMHFNGWPFNAPYAFRGWSEQEWERCIDILSYQHVNLFYLWPFMEIMPVPLSPEDQAYLEECKRVVDYAQKKHGMEVWIMQCTNRVAQDNCGVADPKKRPYWRPSQKDLTPGDPKDFKAIMDSREAMYKIINNADGFCNIDSDPGECPGSPLTDFVKVLNGCREMINRYNIHGKDTLLLDWMWTGWGVQPDHLFDRDTQLKTIQLLKKDLPEPWGLVSGSMGFLPLCKQEGVSGKTVLLQYGVIEGEPSYPATGVDMERIRDTFTKDFYKYKDLAGMMGNVQTPLIQFPHLFLFTNLMWKADDAKLSGPEVLSNLATQLYPDHKQLIVDAYLALGKDDLQKREAVVEELQSLISQDKLGRAGVLGRKIFPDHKIVAQSLLLQLRYLTERQKMANADAHPLDAASETSLVKDYFDAFLEWDLAHGYHGLWGWDSAPFGEPGTIPGAAGLAKAFENEATLDRALAGVGDSLKAKYGEEAVTKGCIKPMKTAVMHFLENLARSAKATASVTPDPEHYPPSAAIDGSLSTRYWPGALIKDNTEWIQLTWDKPQTFDSVVVKFLQYPALRGRKVHLQKETSPGKWEDFAVASIPKHGDAPFAVAEFKLPAKVSLDKVRIVNLLDLFEIEIR